MAIKAILSTTFVDAPEDVYSAKNYAEKASLYATTAQTSETNAATSESNAKKSETNASSSATAAKTSETNAKASETAAATSANDAQSSQSAAASSASQADTSATNAANSATAAANSAATLTYATADEAKAGTATDRIISPSTLKSTIDYTTNQLQRNKEYAVGDIAYSPNLPSWAYLECITAGTTGDTEPDFSSVSPTGGGVIANLSDGTARWRIRDTRCRYEVGDIIAKTTAPKDYEYLMKCDGSSFDTTKYPLLAEVFADGKVPNLTDGRFLEGSTSTGTVHDAGLPNITGNLGIYTYSPSDYSGALSREVLDNAEPKYDNTNKKCTNIKFNASKSNSIYGNSDTVQPKSYTVIYYVCYGG